MNIQKIGMGLLVAVAFTLTACSDQKKKTDNSPQSYLRPAEIIFTHEDTVAIHQLVDTYLGYFNDKDYAQAAEMLYYHRGDSVIPYTDAERNSYVKAMTSIGFHGGALKSILLRNDRNNEVKLLLKVLPDGDLVEEKGVTTISLNPVKTEGHWYLTLRDKDAEGVEDVY